MRATGGGRLVLVVLPVRACGGLRFPVAAGADGLEDWIAGVGEPTPARRRPLPLTLPLTLACVSKADGR